MKAIVIMQVPIMSNKAKYGTGERKYLSKPSEIALVNSDENVLAESMVNEPNMDDVRTGITTERSPKYLLIDIITTAESANVIK
jgi:hypothetical protein